MPIRIKPYNNYTHQEFKAVTIDNQELKKEEKYDRLFDMFFYLSDDKNGIGIYYPARSCLKMLKKPKTKTTKCKDKSNSKSSKSNTRKAKEEEVQQPLMKRKSVKRDTIYTSAV